MLGFTLLLVACSQHLSALM